MTNWLKRAQTVFRETSDRDTAVTDDRNLTVVIHVRISASKRAPTEAVRAALHKETYWAPDSFEAERRLCQPRAKMFSFIGRKVRTPTGPGTLLQVFEGHVIVVLDSEVNRCSFFQPGDIEPVSWEL